MKLSANLPYWILWPTNSKWVGMAPLWCLPCPFFKNIIFSKMTLKISQKLKISKYFCILGNHFIGLLYGILHVLILLVYPEKLKENLLLLNTFWTPLYLKGAQRAHSFQLLLMCSIVGILKPLKSHQADFTNQSSFSVLALEFSFYNLLVLGNFP